MGIGNADCLAIVSLVDHTLHDSRTTLAHIQIFQFMQARKNTKKAAAVKRKTNSYTVADLRALLQEAAGALIAIDQWLDQKISEINKAER